MVKSNLVIANVHQSFNTLTIATSKNGVLQCVCGGRWCPVSSGNTKIDGNECEIIFSLHNFKSPGISHHSIRYLDKREENTCCIVKHKYQIEYTKKIYEKNRI